MFILKIFLFIFFCLNIYSAPKANFAILQLAKYKEKTLNIKIETTTILYPSTDPKSNIEFKELIYINEFNKAITIISDSEENKIAYLHLHDEAYFIEGNYITLKNEFPIGSLLYILFSNKFARIQNIITAYKIDLETIGLGRISDSISRIYGAKEINTYRKKLPLSIKDESQDQLDQAYILNIKPQIWLNKDTFQATRFIFKELSSEPALYDIKLIDYKIFDNTYMFPSQWEIVKDGKIYAKTTVNTIALPPQVKDNIFSTKTDLKKRSLEKMIDSSNKQTIAIIGFFKVFR